MPTRLHSEQELSELQARLGLRFDNLSLLRQALTHESFINECQQTAEVQRPVRSGERLEFLGDAVLNMIVACILHTKSPRADEGELSLARSHIVRKSTLARAARGIGLNKYIVLGRGEAMRSAGERESVLEDAYEAILGAIYVDKGVENGIALAREFIFRTLGDVINDILTNGVQKDPKSTFQELVQARRFPSPKYRTELLATDSSGRKHYKATVEVDKKPVQIGHGHSKAEAQRNAAAKAIKVFKDEDAVSDAVAVESSISDSKESISVAPRLREIAPLQDESSLLQSVFRPITALVTRLNRIA